MTNNTEEEASWSAVLGWLAVTIIGFGFAVLRFLQFVMNVPINLRLSRIERFIYNAFEPSPLIAVFVLMGFVGLYFTITSLRAVRKK
jgi:hypothetical protein